MRQKILDGWNIQINKTQKGIHKWQNDTVWKTIVKIRKLFKGAVCYKHAGKKIWKLYPLILD